MVTYQSIDNLLRTNEALAQFNTTSKQLTQSQKALARTILVLQGARNAWGDASKTINTLENQIRVFQGTIQNLKLTLGDTFAEPFRHVLIYINGFLIGINNMIRALFHLKTTTGNKNENPFSDLSKSAEEADDAVGLLKFDEFNVLEQGGQSELAENQAITDELENQLSIYQEQYEQMQERMGKIHNYAVEIGNIISGWFVNAVENNPEFVESFNKLAKTLAELFKPLGSLLEAILPMLEPILDITLKLVTPLINIVNEIIKLLDKSGALQAFLMILIGGLISIKTVNPLGAIISMVLALGVIIKNLVKNWDEIKEHIKEGIKSIGDFLGNVVVSMGKAIVNFVNLLVDLLNGLLSPLDAVAGLFGGKVKIPHWELPQYAQGGIPSVGSMFIAGEAGAELVGNIGGQTNVINMEQLTQAVQQGALSAILQAYNYMGDAGEEPQTISIQIDGKEVFKSVQNTAKSFGLGFTQVK